MKKNTYLTIMKKITILAFLDLGFSNVGSHRGLALGESNLHI